MKLSSPIHVLKSKAKKLKIEHSISMTQALNLVAKEEGFNSWSLLISKKSDILPRKYSEILDFFNNGDLVLIGARPGFGKTSFTMGLFVQAIEQERPKGFCFTLAETHKDLAGRIATYNERIGENDDRFDLNYSNDICAEYIISVAEEKVQPGSVIVIDYLQLLDEKRTNPPLQDQILQLKNFAKEKGCIIIFLSQIAREIEYRVNQRPTTNDIRLPNPLDTNLLNKMIFLYRDNKSSNQAEVIFSGKTQHSFNIGWDKRKIKFFDL